MKKSVLVKRAYGNFYDVFFNDGWDDWTRVLYKRKHGEVVYIKGQALSEADTTALKSMLEERSHA